MEKKKEVNLLLWLVIAVVVVAAVVVVFVFAGPKTQPQAKPSQTEPVQTQAPVEEEGSSIYAMVPEDWQDVHIWAWEYLGEDAFEAWPGKPMTLGQDGWYSAKIPTWADCVIINGNDGTVQTYDLMLGAGLDAWIHVRTAENVNITYEKPSQEELEIDPFLAAALAEDYETMKELLPTIEDRSILKEWDYNDFNYAYATDAIRAGDYETAIEFFNYCAFEDHRLYATIFQQLLDGDVEGAIETKLAMGFTTLNGDLDMTWPEIICQVIGVEKDESDLDYILMNKYLTRRMWTNQPNFTEDSLVFGEYSAWTSEGYIGEIGNTEDYPPISDLNTLYSQCGSEPNGKVLVVRSQKSYPQGSTYYAIDMSVMEYLSYDLYPASLSEVEYVIVVNYDYIHAGSYQQTFSMGDNSVVDYFTFLRMKGQVQLVNALNRTAIQTSPWVQGTGNVEAHFSDLDYQCSNMPETGTHIISAVEKVRELNAAK